MRRKRMIGGIPLHVAMGAGLIASQVDAGDNTLVYDSFTDTDGTLLVNHTPDIDTVGGGWIATNLASDVEINSNQAQLLVDGQGAVIGTGKSDVEITASITSGGRISFALRRTNSSNFWSLQSRSDTGQILIVEVNGGGATVRATANVTLSTPYTLTATALGQTITLSANDTTISYASAVLNQTITQHGFIRNTTATTVRLDDFRVRPL